MAKIWIDAGHGGGDSGAVNGIRYEKNDNLTYALKLQREFERRGMEVIMTRTTDCYPSLSARTKLERVNNCDLAICCHRNGGSATATGLEIWLHSKAPASYINWAADMIAGVKVVGMKARCGRGGYGEGIYKGYRASPLLNYYCNSGTNSPSMLVELGFITNEEDNQIFDENLDALVAAIADASCRFLGPKK